MPTSRLALALSLCLLVASMASAQTLRQVKPDFIGIAVACIDPKDTDQFHRAVTQLAEGKMSGADPDRVKEASAIIDRWWERRVELGTCGFLTAEGQFHAMRDDEEWPELVGIDRNTNTGRPLGGRIYWTRKEWIEPVSSLYLKPPPEPCVNYPKGWTGPRQAKECPR